MTAEDRIAQLEAALALERAKVHELAAALAVSVQRAAEAEASRARREESEAHAKALRRERNRRHRDAKKSSHETLMRRSGDVSETSHSPSPPLDGSPLSSKPSLPSPLSSPQPLSASQGMPSASPSDFALTSPASKKQRRPSAAEALFNTLSAHRKQRCDEVGEPFVEENWPHARRNRDLKPVLERDEAGKARFEAAWGLYLADDGQRARTPAWSLSWFMQSGVLAKYETMAAREEA